MTRLCDLLARALRSIRARPGRAALAAFGIGLGAAAALELLGAAGASSAADAPRRPPPTRIPRLMVSTGERESVASVWTPTPAQLQRAGLRVGEGRMLADLDRRDARRVAVLGAELRAELFGFRSGLARTILVGGTRFTVVGVLEPRSAAAGSGEPDPNRAVLLPEGAVDAQLAQLRPSGEAFPRGAGAVRGRAAPSQLGALAALALLLGGGALGSAMLATVIERAREIALRRVVGATPGEVFVELLAESALVGALGGLAGVAIALAAPAPGLARAPADLLAWSAPAVLALAALVGAAAGLLPALRAAGIDPVRALGSDD